jgi:hypothetical protein
VAYLVSVSLTQEVLREIDTFPADSSATVPIIVGTTDEWNLSFGFPTEAANFGWAAVE